MSLSVKRKYSNSQILQNLQKIKQAQFPDLDAETVSQIPRMRGLDEHSALLRKNFGYALAHSANMDLELGIKKTNERLQLIESEFVQLQKINRQIQRLLHRSGELESNFEDVDVANLAAQTQDLSLGLEIASSAELQAEQITTDVVGNEALHKLLQKSSDLVYSELEVVSDAGEEVVLSEELIRYNAEVNAKGNKFVRSLNALAEVI